MDKISETFDSIVNTTYDKINNNNNMIGNIFIYVLILVLILYVPFIRPNLPKSVEKLFNNPIFRLCAYSYIVYRATYDVKTALVVASVFILIIHMLNKQTFINEHFYASTPTKYKSLIDNFETMGLDLEIRELNSSVIVTITNMNPQKHSKLNTSSIISAVQNITKKPITIINNMKIGDLQKKLIKELSSTDITISFNNNIPTIMSYPTTISLTETKNIINTYLSNWALPKLQPVVNASNVTTKKSTKTIDDIKLALGITNTTATASNAPIKASIKTPTQAPTDEPTDEPTIAATRAPTIAATRAPTIAATRAPMKAPTIAATRAPMKAPTIAATRAPTNARTYVLTNPPTNAPMKASTNARTYVLTNAPTNAPSIAATRAPTNAPSIAATMTTPYATTSIPTNASPNILNLFSTNGLSSGNSVFPVSSGIIPTTYTPKPTFFPQMDNKSILLQNDKSFSNDTIIKLAIKTKMPNGDVKEYRIPDVRKTIDNNNIIIPLYNTINSNETVTDIGILQGSNFIPETKLYLADTTMIKKWDIVDGMGNSSKYVKVVN